MQHKKKIHINASSSLFLDRDGVINKRIEGDYVKAWDQFEFLPGVEDAIACFSKLFKNIFIVTNQQGVGKGQMSHDDIGAIHNKMIQEITEAGGRIDNVYYCPDLADSGSFNRKPNIGMGLKAKKDFPVVNFKNAIMVGDSISDMKFGKRLKMKTVFISSDISEIRKHRGLIDFAFKSLLEFSQRLM